MRHHEGCFIVDKVEYIQGEYLVDANQKLGLPCIEWLFHFKLHKGVCSCLFLQFFHALGCREYCKVVCDVLGLDLSDYFEDYC